METQPTTDNTIRCPECRGEGDFVYEDREMSVFVCEECGHRFRALTPITAESL